MKKIFTLIIGIVFSITVLNSQVAPPKAFSFKATIKDKSGLPVLLKKINLKMSILQGGSNGSVAYAEFFTPTTDLYSQVDVQIGKGTVLSGSFSSIDWSSYEYFLKIDVDLKGGTNYQLLLITQLLSVPYALFAGKSENEFSGNYNDLKGAPNLALVATTGQYNDLLGRPSLFSGDYNDLTDKPAIDGSETKITAGTNIKVTGTGTTATPYVINATNVGATAHYIGEIYGGGIVFYVYKDANGDEHGLILSLNRWTDIPFGDLYLGETTSNWNGAANTSYILANNRYENEALNLCHSYSGGGFNDWYLPSLGELQMLWTNLYIIDKIWATLKPDIELRNTYWTSTIWGIPPMTIMPYLFSLQDATSTSFTLGIVAGVIAVRAF